MGAVDTSASAWQPLTPRGVAAFAHSPWRRLWLVQALVALAVAAGVVAFLQVAWFPVVRQAIAELPEVGEVRGGELHWTNASPRVLAENRFLALSVDLEHSGQVRSLAHFHVELGRHNILTQGLLGYLVTPYPPGWVLAANRVELTPRWEAWRFVIVVAVVLLVVGGLGVTWWGLGLFYAAPLWWVGYFANRDLTWNGSWRLACAALLPGALVMLGAISFYTLGVMDLVQLGFIFAAHVLVGWIYAAWSLACVPRVVLADRPPRNPFGGRT